LPQKETFHTTKTQEDGREHRVAQRAGFREYQDESNSEEGPGGVARDAQALNNVSEAGNEEALLDSEVEFLDLEDCEV
jgi:hypothetical protein